MIPDFLVIGASKCGTTYIDACLREHPEIYVPPMTKEVFYFDKNYHKGINWYLKHFKYATSQHKVLGECTASYFHSKECPKRIYQTNPNCKLIISLRDPVERCISNYFHKKRYGETNLNFYEALEKIPSLINESLYFTQLTNFLKYFDKNQIYIIIYEDLKSNPEICLRKIYDFLGVDNSFKPQSLYDRFNVRKLPRNYILSKLINKLNLYLRSKQQYWLINFAKKIGFQKIIYTNKAIDFEIDRKWSKYLYSKFENDIQMLEKYLNRNLYFWKKY